MDSTTFVIALGCIGFLTGIMGFSEDIAKLHSRMKWVDTLPTKLVVLFIATIGTVLATNAYNNKNDTVNDAKLRKQAAEAETEQNKRDAINRNHIDSINNNYERLLADYGLKLNHTKDSILNAMDTSMGKNVPNVIAYSEETQRFHYSISIDTVVFPIGLQNNGNAVAYDVSATYQTIIPTQNGYIKTNVSDLFNGHITLGVPEQGRMRGAFIKSTGVETADSLFLVVHAKYKNFTGKSFDYKDVLIIFPKDKHISYYEYKRNPLLLAFIRRNKLL